MAECSYCGEKVSLPFKCKFCGKYFCPEHRLPENHDCEGLKEFKEKRAKSPEKWIYEPFHPKYREEPVRKIKKPRIEIIQRNIIYGILILIALILIYSLIKGY